MYCELLKKNVEIEVAKEFRTGKDNDIVQTFYNCSECFPEINGSGGRKMYQPCDMMSDKKCLLKHM